MSVRVITRVRTDWTCQVNLDTSIHNPNYGTKTLCLNTNVKFLKKFCFRSLHERKWLFSRENRLSGIFRILLPIVFTRNKTRRPRSHGCHPRKWWDLSNHRRKSFQRGFRKTCALSHAFLWYVRLLWSVKGLKLSIYRKFRFLEIFRNCANPWLVCIQNRFTCKIWCIWCYFISRSQCHGYSYLFAEVGWPWQFC